MAAVDLRVRFYHTTRKVTCECNEEDTNDENLEATAVPGTNLFFFFVTLPSGPRRSLSLKLRDTRVYELRIRARIGTTAQLSTMVVLKLRAVPTRYGGTSLTGKRLLLGSYSRPMPMALRWP